MQFFLHKPQKNGAFGVASFKFAVKILFMMPIENYHFKNQDPQIQSLMEK
jgi:hypothetical protein